jgi:hypothetical protein
MFIPADDLRPLGHEMVKQYRGYLTQANETVVSWLRAREGTRARRDPDLSSPLPAVVAL